MHQDEIKALFDRQAASYDTQWAKTAPIRSCLHLLLGSLLAELPTDAKILLSNCMMERLASWFLSSFWKKTNVLSFSVKLQKNLSLVGFLPAPIWRQTLNRYNMKYYFLGYQSERISMLPNQAIHATSA